MDTQNKVAG